MKKPTFIRLKQNIGTKPRYCFSIMRNSLRKTGATPLRAADKPDFARKEFESV
jgi:hypothetical protein